MNTRLKYSIIAALILGCGIGIFALFKSQNTSIALGMGIFFFVTFIPLCYFKC